MKYDIHTTCPICNDPIDWINGKTNSGVVYIKSRRKTVNLYHEKCIDNERVINNEEKRSC